MAGFYFMQLNHPSFVRAGCDTGTQRNTVTHLAFVPPWFKKDHCEVASKKSIALRVKSEIWKNKM